MYEIDNLPGYIPIGNQRDFGHTIQLDLTAWADLNADDWKITYTRPGESVTYPVLGADVSVAGNVLTWNISEVVTAINGTGSVVIEAYRGGEMLKHSDRIMTIIGDGHEPAGEAPDPVADWIREADAKLDEVDESLERTNAAEDLRETAETARETAEGLRAGAETSRNTAEGLRVSAETARNSAEGLRNSAETAREEAEALRVAAEAARMGFVPKGPYIPTNENKYGEWYTHEGGSWGYIWPEPSTGVPLADTSHWQQIASRGMTGPSAYEAAVAGGYTGTEAEFNAANAGIEAAKDAALDAAQTANEASEIALAISTADTWERVAYFVRLGKGPQVFPVGTEFNVVTPTYGTQKFKVAAHNHHKNALDIAAPTMTLLMNRAIYGRPFDATNAIYHAPDGLAAGAYYLTLPAGYDVAYGGGKSYQFTLAQAVPAGGVILFPWGYNTDAALTKVSTYATPASTVAIESNVSVTEGTTGTFLGLADGTAPNMNHIQRARYGSNEYKYSAARLWLNSEAAANAWYVPPTKYSRAPSYANVPGFMGELPADLRAILVPVDHICARNTVFEFDGVVGGSYTVRDKIFLPSMAEVGFGSNNSIAEGTVMQLYAAATNADRIKYDSSAATTARYWFLRSEIPSNAFHVRIVLTDGSLHYYHAIYGFGLAPACVIG